MDVAHAAHRKFARLPAALLAWYDSHARDLPWRVGPSARAAGASADPYRVWLSEIMLQQTTIAHGTRYFLDFTERWPNVEALADAADEDVMAAWAGLGYYARARNLLKCARVVADQGGFPHTRAELQKLPGIGPYTAGAIAAIAFGERAAAVDGNVERVCARLLAAGGAWAQVKQDVRALVEAMVPDARPGEFAEAFMDLGATVCTPKRPNCLICPLRDMCAARAAGQAERYPLKPKKAKTPTRRGAALVVRDGDYVKLVRRPASGLLGGMLALPSSEWGAAEGDIAGLCAREGADVDSVVLLGEVRHVFTHFSLILEVYEADGVRGDAGEKWVARGEVAGLPSVFTKAYALAQPSSPFSER